MKGDRKHLFVADSMAVTWLNKAMCSPSGGIPPSQAQVCQPEAPHWAEWMGPEQGAAEGNA